MLTGFSINRSQLAKRCQVIWLRALWVLVACLFLPAMTQAVNNKRPLSFTPIPGDPFRNPEILAELAELEATVYDTDQSKEVGQQAVQLFRQLAQGRGGKWNAIIHRLKRATAADDFISNSLLGWRYLYSLGVVQNNE